MSWVRDSSPFEPILGKYQVAEALDAYKQFGNRNYGSLLDVGCSNAFLTQNYLKYFKRVDGIDSDQDLVGNARKRCPDANFYVSSIQEFTPETKYDYIVVLNVFEHLEEPVEALEKLKGMINSTGIIHIQVPNAYSLNRRIGEKMQIIRDVHEVTEHDREYPRGEKTLGHRVIYDLETLKMEVWDSGLKSINSGGFFLKPFTNAQMQLLIDKWRDADPKWSEKLCDALYVLGKEMREMPALIYVTCGLI